VCIATRLGVPTGASVLEREDKFTCAGCWKCAEICPQGIDIYKLMMEARRKGELPESFRMGIRNILETGYAMPMRGVNAIREMYRLPPIERVKPEVVKKLLRGVSVA
jgi:heterodisulfide reductase subunit C